MERLTLHRISTDWHDVPLKSGDLVTWHEILRISQECAEQGMSFGKLYAALRHLGYSRQAVANWVTDGLIPHYRSKASRGYEPVNSRNILENDNLEKP